MHKVPLLSGREVVKVFRRLGWDVARQRGSHIILVKEGHIATLSVPDHHGEAISLNYEIAALLSVAMTFIITS